MEIDKQGTIQKLDGIPENSRNKPHKNQIVAFTARSMFTLWKLGSGWLRTVGAK